MRVLVDVSAVPERPVGAGNYTRALVAELSRSGAVDLVLLARKNDGARWNAIAPNAEVHALVPRSRPLRLVWEQARGPRFAARARLDVWHGPHYTLPLRASIPMVTTVLDLIFFDHPEWHERSKVAYFRRMIPRAVRRAAVCICISDHTARRLATAVPNTTPTVVIHLGVDHDRFRADPGAVRADHAALATHGITEPYVAFLGTVEPRKAVPTLVAAFARVAPSHPEWSLVVAGGDGWGADAVTAAIADSGVSSRIVRTGYLPADAIAPLLRRAEVVAYPSLEEGFGLPALEALACGAPLVTTTGSAVEELVDGAAILVPADDVDALAGGLERAGDPATASRLRSEGPRRAAGFTWEACAGAHVEVYRRALEGYQQG